MKYEKKKLTRLISTIAILSLFAVMLAWPAARAFGLVADLDPMEKPSYLLGETLSFSGSVVFTDEDPGISTVIIYIDGPQPVTQEVPITSGVYTYPANNLEVTVTQSGDLGYGYVGEVTVTYDAEWAAPVFLSPPPVFKVVPNYEVAFSIPVPAPTPTPTPGGPAQLSDTTLAFSIPMPETPTPAPGAASDLPGFDEAFSVPLLSTPEPPVGVATLPDTTTAFEVPLLPTPEPDPTAPDDLPTVTEAWTIPVPPTPTPVPGIPTLGTTALAFNIPDGQVPEGIATDDTNFYILVNGPWKGSNDQVLKVDSAGTQIDSFYVSTSRAQGITYLNDYLYIADNEVWPPKIMKVDPLTGSTLSEFDSPDGNNIRGLTNDGTRLWMANEWGWAFYKVTTGGTVLDTIWTNWTNFNAVAIESGYAFLAQADKVGSWSIETKQSLTSWFTSPTVNDVRGMVFSGGVLYLVDAETLAVYQTQPPSLEEVTNEAQGMAYDGTNLYIAVNGSPTDKILTIDPDTGTLINSYDAPDDQIDGLAYVGSNLYALSNVDRKMKKLDPATGAVISEFSGPGWDNLTGLTTDGTDLYMGQRTGQDIYIRSTSGIDRGNLADWGSPLDGYQSMAYRSLNGEIYSSLGNAIGRFADDGIYLQDWTTSLDDIKAIAFIGDVLYVADIGSGKVYKASIPSGVSITQDPLGLTTDGTYLYVLTDALPKDKVLKITADLGDIVTSFDAPSGECDGITYLDGYLYVVDNTDNGDGRKIRKLDPADGSEVDNFPSPGGGWDSWQNADGLTNDGTDLLVGMVNMSEIRKIRASDGYDLETYYSDWNDPRTKSSGLAYNSSTGEIFAADGSIKKVARLDGTGHYKQSWLLSALTDITGLTFIGDVLYAADNGTDTIYKASIPAGVQVTNEPQGLAYDGTTLYILVDALPVDKIIKVDPNTGALQGDISAPSEQIDAMTYLGGSLYVADNFDPNNWGDRRIRKLNPTDGSEEDFFMSPGGGWDDITSLTNDGTDLIVGRRNNRDLFRVRTSDGMETESYWGDWNDPRGQTQGLAFKTFDSQDYIFAVDPGIKKIVKLDSEGNYMQLWTLSTLTKMKGLTFVGDTLYVADADSKKIYKASVPSGGQVTTVPQGLTYGGTTLYILVDALPQDKILRVDPSTGALLTVTGTHNGGADTDRLFDSTAAFVTDRVAVGDTLKNVTDGSSCTITAVLATTITCTLSGGTDNDWDVGDAYEIADPAYDSAPSSMIDAITYLDGYLYVADNFDYGNGQRNIRKLDTDDGSEVDSFISPGGGWDDITSLTNDGTNLIVGRRNNWDLFRVNPSTGTEISSMGADWNDPRTSTDALGYHALADEFLAADGKKLVRLDSEFHFLQSWTTTLLDIRGVTFIGDMVYVADADSEGIHYALIPGASVTTSTAPTDLATDGTYLYVITDGSPVDTVLVLNRSDGSVVDSFDAPGDNADAMTYMDGYLYVATNEWQDGFQGQIHKVDPATGVEVEDGNYPFPNPDWREIGALAPGSSLGSGFADSLIAGPKYDDRIFIIDLANPYNVQPKWVSPGDNPSLWVGNFEAMAEGSLYTISGSNFLKIEMMGSEPRVMDMRTLPMDLNITGMAFIGTTLYMADANNNRILASTAPGNRPEVTTAGGYEAYLGVQVSGQPEVTSGVIDFALVKITDVMVDILQPEDGHAFLTPSATVIATVNDPSINTVFLGLDLPFSEVLSDSVEDSAMSNQIWTQSGLWQRTNAGKSASPTHAWYYGQVPAMDYETGGSNSGDLTSWEFDVGDDATLGFDTWYDTEPGDYADLKMVQVYGTLDTGGGDETKWWNVAQILDWLSTPPPPVPSDSAPGFGRIQVPMAHFEFIQGEPQPVPIFDRVFLNLSDFAGQTVRIRFHFDTVDAKINNLEGWYVDNIVVGSSASSGQAVARGTDGKFTATIDLVQGDNDIRVKAVNPYTEPSLTGSEEVHVALDTMAPIVAIEPVMSPTNIPSQAITVHFEEPNWDQFTLNVTNSLGSKIVASIKEEPTGESVTQTVALTAGDNIITATLTDRSGLTSSDSRTILLDVQAPDIVTLDTLYPVGEVSARPGSGTHDGDRTILQANAGDTDAGVSGIYAIIPGGSGEEPEVVPFLWAGSGPPPEGFEAIPQAVRDQWGATADFILPMRIPSGAPPGTYELTIFARDYAGNESYGSASANIQGVLSGYNTYLMPEWNLVSLPLIPDSTLYAADGAQTQIEKLIGSITGLDRVWYYDAATTAWQIFEPGAPSDLGDMTTGKGYWVYMDPIVFSTSPPLGPGLPDTPIPIKFSYSGKFLEPGEVPPTYSLEEGWNLVGFHGEWSKDAQQYLAGVSYPARLWAYLLQYNNYIKFTGEGDSDIQLGGFASLDENSTMEPGLGYWLFLGSAGNIAP